MTQYYLLYQISKTVLFSIQAENVIEFIGSTWFLRHLLNEEERIVQKNLEKANTQQREFLRKQKLISMSSLSQTNSPAVRKINLDFINKQEKQTQRRRDLTIRNATRDNRVQKDSIHFRDDTRKESKGSKDTDGFGNKLIQGECHSHLSGKSSSNWSEHDNEVGDLPNPENFNQDIIRIKSEVDKDTSVKIKNNADSDVNTGSFKSIRRMSIDIKHAHSKTEKEDKNEVGDKLQQFQSKFTQQLDMRVGGSVKNADSQNTLNLKFFRRQSTPKNGDFDSERIKKADEHKQFANTSKSPNSRNFAVYQKASFVKQNTLKSSESEEIQEANWIINQQDIKKSAMEKLRRVVNNIMKKPGLADEIIRRNQINVFAEEGIEDATNKISEKSRINSIYTKRNSIGNFDDLKEANS